jgi:NAD(P)-dependent dehydrogenase (short-subunit alcohol dehydrogenase family)
VRLRNKSQHDTGSATRADASFFAAYVSAFLEELGWKNFGNELLAASTVIHPFDLFKDFHILDIEQVVREFGRIDVLFNNCGVGANVDVWRRRPGDWHWLDGGTGPGGEDGAKQRLGVVG